MLTLHENVELVRSAFRAGAHGYLLKSDAETELAAALKAVIAERPYISTRIDPEVIRSVVREINQMPKS